MSPNIRAIEDIEGKFLAAWQVFGHTCGQFIAPEPTYQAWFSHYLISQFGIDRVAREPGVKKKHFARTPWFGRVDGDQVRLDVVVMRSPGVHLPHIGNHYDPAPDGTGLARLGDMAVMSELKVTATQATGQSHGAVTRDVYKLSMLLEELSRTGVEQLPLAYVCVLDNHPKKHYSERGLNERLAKLEGHPGVKVVIFDFPPQQRPKWQA